MTEPRTTVMTPNVKIAFLRARMLRTADALDGFAEVADAEGFLESAKAARAQADELRRDVLTV